MCSEHATILQAGSHHTHDYRLAVQKWTKHTDRQQGRGRGRNARYISKVCTFAIFSKRRLEALKLLLGVAADNCMTLRKGLPH